MNIAFLSPTSFRLYDEAAPKSACALDQKALSGGAIGEDQSVYANGLLHVQLNQDNLVILYRGKEVFSAVPFSEEGEDIDHSLAEKEGHAHEQGRFEGGGMKIRSVRPVYGLGERSGPLEKRGYDYIDWNTDDPSAHVDTFKSLYQSIPFFILFDGDDSVGVFLDNTAKVHFDFNKSHPEEVRISYVSGKPDYYFFVGTMKDIIAEFTRLSGRNPLCPYWALGAQQSRWSYPSKEKVDEVVRRYRENDLPLSVVYLDIDYMDAYKDFTVDPKKFPNIREWLSEKKEEGIVVVPIIDAGVKAEPGYFLYDEGIQNGYFSTLNGEVYHNEVWPGDSVFPAFLDERVQRWWAIHIASFLELGFGGIWNDMNEPASFRGPLPLDVEMGEGIKHDTAHNVYGHFMVKAGAMGFEMAGKRLFQLTRAGYAGTCRYSGTWAGDNQSIWDHLRLSLPQLMNMSLSGQAYIGVDIGGFGGDTTPELAAKWAIASLLNPLYRNHSALGTKDQEPYTFTGVYLETYRKALKLRYRLRPAIYTELYLSEIKGTPALRPLVYNYPSQERVLNENTEIMLGENLLLIPSLFPGEMRRAGYFSEDFRHVESQKLYEAGDAILDVSLPNIPLFYKRNSIVPLEDDEKTLRLLCGDGPSPRGLLYEDEGDGLAYREGKYNLYELKIGQGRVSVSYLHHGMTSRYQKVVVCYPDHEEIIPFVIE